MNMGTTPRPRARDGVTGIDTAGSGSVVPQRVDPASGRAEVLQAVVDLALAGGYSAVSWETVAARSGLGLREVQRHATTIDELLLVTLEACLQRWISAAPTWSRVDPVPGLSDEISRRLLTGVDAAADCPEFWALGILLCLTADHGAHRARARYAAVRASARAAIAEWWSRILPPESVAADPRLPHRLTGVHFALVDGAFVAQQSGVEWNLPVLVRIVSAGLTSYVRSTRVDA
jgi:AcrR family transcriptional regulator